jgi:ZIP family zinc transporter
VNTVGIVLNNEGGRRLALGWLLVDAAAPVLGAAATSLLSLEEAALGLGLALIAGFFLYISASDLLPESYHDHPTGWTTAMTILGIAVLYVAIRLSTF